MKQIELLYEYKLIFLLTAVFLIGFAANSVIASLNAGVEKPVSLGLFGPMEVASPSNHIKKDNIRVYPDKVVIDLAGVQWAEFTDTNSMDPVLDSDANSFEIAPGSEDDISVGDIIAYRPDSFEGLIVHRVVSIGEDENGWFAITKGDNVGSPDPGKVRFGQVSGVLVGIIY